MSTTATIAPAGNAPAGVPPARKKKKAAPIPDHLIYETLDGIPLDYAGYVFTNSRKVTTAANDAPWLTANWHDDIQVMGHTLNLQALVERLEREIGQ